jgi:hypothetical protein
MIKITYLIRPVIKDDIAIAEVFIEDEEPSKSEMTLLRMGLNKELLDEAIFDYLKEKSDDGII